VACEPTMPTEHVLDVAFRAQRCELVKTTFLGPKNSCVDHVPNGKPWVVMGFTYFFVCLLFTPHSLPY